jgi:outer membrane biosynthesis protein TonB
MEPIQINVTVKLDDATQAFLSSLFGGLVKPAGEQTKPVTQQKPAATPAPVEQQKPAEQKPAEQKPAEQKPAEQKPAEQKPAAAPAQSSITIDSLRELAMTKMNAHRVEIKQKLTELGTPSITKLDAAKYQEMYDFLKGLE